MKKVNMVGQIQNGATEETIEEGRENLQNRRLFEDAKWFKVLRKGREREIVLFIVVELFRFIFYLWFVVFFIVGLTLTHGFTPYLEEESNTKQTVTKVFGNGRDCMSPSTQLVTRPWLMEMPSPILNANVSCHTHLFKLVNACLPAAFLVYILSPLGNRKTGKFDFSTPIYNFSAVRLQRSFF